jgi:hypothetical protein
VAWSTSADELTAVCFACKRKTKNEVEPAGEKRTNSPATAFATVHPTPCGHTAIRNLSFTPCTADATEVASHSPNVGDVQFKPEIAAVKPSSHQAALTVENPEQLSSSPKTRLVSQPDSRRRQVAFQESDASVAKSGLVKRPRGMVSGASPSPHEKRATRCLRGVPRCSHFDKKTLPSCRSLAYPRRPHVRLVTQEAICRECTHPILGTARPCNNCTYQSNFRQQLLLYRASFMRGQREREYK